MQTIQFLVLATAIAALIGGLNVSQVAHAQSQGTCQVGSNNALPLGNPTSNPVSGNPHCFDPEQQPLGTTATSAQSGPPPPPPTGTCTTNPCTSAGGGGNHPQSTNGVQITGNPHEELSSCPTGPAPTCPQSTNNPNSHTNPQGSVVANPHYIAR